METTELKPTKKTMSKIVKWGCLPLLGSFIILMIIGVLLPDSPKKTTVTKEPSTAAAVTQSETKPPVTQSTTITPEVAVVLPPSAWVYNETIDEMDNTKTYLAYNESPDILNFDFPYGGGSTLSITVRKTGKELDIYLRISKGQFLTYNEAARLKFDDNNPIKVGLTGAADGSADIVFLNSTSLLLSNLKKSKKLMVEVPFYQAGRQRATFDIQNLDWNH